MLNPYNRSSAKKTFARLLSAIMIMALVVSMLPVTALAAAANSAAFTSSTIPAAMTAGQSYTVKITVKNTGSATWTAAGGYKLVAVNGSDPLATARSYGLAAGDSIKPNATKQFVITMKAPLKSASVMTDWQMAKGATKFGPVYKKAVKITILANNSLIVSTSIPKKVAADAGFTVNIAMKNIGLNKWTKAGSYSLVVTVEDNFEGPVNYTKVLNTSDSISFGSTKTFAVDLWSPLDEGVFQIHWQMYCGTAKFGASGSASISVFYTEKQKLDMATMMVETAEAVNMQFFSDLAQLAVDELADGPDKSALQARLDDVQDIIDSITQYTEQMATVKKAVIKAEVSDKQSDLDAAKTLLAKLQDSTFKTKMQARITAEQKVIDVAAAKVVVAQINALPLPGVLKLTDKATVLAVRAHYNALTTVQKSLVQVGKLKAAEYAIAVLELAKADLDAAKVVDNKIATLPLPAALTLANKNAVVAARTAYTGLTAARKLLVTKLSVLVNAETKIAQLVAEDAAEQAVEAAEASKLQGDVDKAQGLVTNLPASTVKTGLQARIDAVQDIIDA